MVQHSAGRCTHTPQHTTEPPHGHEREYATRSALRALLLLLGSADPVLARLSDAELAYLGESMALLGRIDMPTHA